MIKLLEAYSIQEILLFLAFFLLALKEFLTLFDWLKERFGKGYEKELKSSQLKEDLKKEEAAINNLKSNQENLLKTIDSLTEKMDALIDSDKDDIKSFLVREHHYFCYQKKWIDDYSLDCCEKRYKHYVQEGGNSFVHDLMEEIRSLPKIPPET